MSFNRDIKIDPNRVSTGGGGRGAAIGGGSIITVLAVLLISHFTGVDLTGLLGQDQGTTSSATSSIDMSVCGDGTTANGDAANQYPQCRMVATAESLDAVWGEQLPAQAVRTDEPSHRRKPGLV